MSNCRGSDELPVSKNPLAPSSRLRYSLHMIPIALTIAGSDCSAGAGIQADLKTFQHFGVFGLTAITCVVSETPRIVRKVHPVPVDVVIDQVELLLESYPIGAIKTGMLFSLEHITSIAAILSRFPHIPLVVDPVMIASTGAPLIEPDAIAAYQEILLPLSWLMTPNLPEAQTLLDGRTITSANIEQSARDLAEKYSTNVLLKGGHLFEDSCPDFLCEAGELSCFEAPRLETEASHGTGCTLSAAIAAHLAKGETMFDACEHAKRYIGDALAQSLQWSHQEQPVIHMLNQGTSLEQNR